MGGIFSSGKIAGGAGARMRRRSGEVTATEDDIS